MRSNRDKLKEAGREVEILVLEDEEHGFSKKENKTVDVRLSIKTSRVDVD